MTAIIFENRLTATKKDLTRTRSEIEAAKAEKQRALVDGRSAAPIKLQLKTLQEKLEDLEITKTALEGKLRLYKQGEPEAAQALKQISTTRSQRVDGYAKITADLQRLRTSLTEDLAKDASLEMEENTLTAKHMQLIGEPVSLPTLTLYSRAFRDILDHLADKSLDAPVPSWTYLSESERLASIAKQKTEAKLAEAARIKIAQDEAPLCSECAKRKKEQKMTLRFEEVHGSGVWSYQHCFKLASKKIPETALQSK